MLTGNGPYTDAQLELAGRVLFNKPAKVIPYHLG
jgi:hypothetical protein